MDEDRAKELLRALVAWGVRPGARVVTEKAVQQAGADPAVIGRLVEEGGGVRVRSTSPYWLVPESLLR